MRSVKAIFKKQAKDTYKNMSTLMQFIVYPAVAFAFSMLMGDIKNLSVPNMMASIFVGMGIVIIVAGVIAEDKENKSLRFLVMAGVKPTTYLLGIGSFIFLVSLVPSVAFSLINKFYGQEFWLYMALMMSGVLASILLGAIVGILSKNQQAATGMAMPIAMILGFGPMLAQFNEVVKKIFSIFYTQQLNVVSGCIMTGHELGTVIWKSFATMWINIAILVVLFVFSFTKKGLKS